jgi:hypothetical protein
MSTAACRSCPAADLLTEEPVLPGEDDVPWPGVGLGATGDDRHPPERCAGGGWMFTGLPEPHSGFPGVGTDA